MKCLNALGNMLSEWITANFGGQASSSAQFSLISDPGTDLDDRDFDWGGDIENYECNFHGYSTQSCDNGGGGSDWLPTVEDGVKVKSGQVSVTFTRNDGEPHANTRTTATHLVLLGNDAGSMTIIEVWELPAPIAFDADGVSRTIKVRMSEINAIDVA